MHAGLECGIIGANYPGLDMISFGPTIKHPHSPNEKVEISTVETFWKLLVAVLENISGKRLNTIFVKSRRYGKRYRRLFLFVVYVVYKNVIFVWKMKSFPVKFSAGVKTGRAFVVRQSVFVIQYRRYFLKSRII